MFRLAGKELPTDAEGGAARLGRPAFDGAKATVLRLLRLGYALATTLDQRNELATHGMHVHRALGETRTGILDFLSSRLTPDRHGLARYRLRPDPRHPGSAYDCLEHARPW